MQKFSSVNKNLIAISVISTILVFWLSSSFWVEAYTQRKAAAQLQLSTKPELTLFQLASSLDQERSILNLMLLGEKDNNDNLDTLYEISETTNNLMQTAFAEIRYSRNIDSMYIEHRYSDQSVETLMLNLAEGYERLSFKTSIIQAQIATLLPHGQERIRMKLFDDYGRLIQEVDNLRHRTHFLPARNYQNVVAAHELKNALWSLNEAINQNRSLLDGYLVKTENNTVNNLNIDGLLYRAYQQIQSAEQSMFEFADFFESNSADSDLRDQVQTLLDWYAQQYQPYEKELLNTLSNELPITQSAEQFRTVSDALSQKIRAFSDETINQTFASADSINRIASRNLLIDTFLVLICVGMAIASMKVSRKVQHQATHDDLTKLPNRRYFTHHIQTSLPKVNSEFEKLVLITIDLDRFKSINDTMGHAVGDALLMQVAERLSECCDQRMTIARMGGDEFATLFTTDDHADPDRVAEALQQALDKTFDIEGVAVNVGASFGISQYPDNANTAEELQVTSDFAMFHAKQDGESKIQHYNREMAERFENRLQIERDLGIAITERQLELYYQPQFNLNENRIDAVEALIRWNHPTRGFMPPIEFIEIAEESGLMPAMGKWVLDEACRQVAIWNNQCGLGIRVAVNVSVHQIMQKEFVDQVFEAIERNNIEPCYLELEITESVVMADVDWVIQSLHVLKNAGIKIALDDFGTGYSSLSQLQNLPLNTLKIDRSFISKLESQSEVTHSFTATIAKLAETLGLETVAEGVESDIQCSLIAQLGIDVVQGYYYSKPVPSKDIPTAITKIDATADSHNKAA